MRSKNILAPFLLATAGLVSSCGTEGSVARPNLFARQSPQKLTVIGDRIVPIPGVQYHPARNAQLMNIEVVNDRESIPVTFRHIIFLVLSGLSGALRNFRVLDEQGVDYSATVIEEISIVSGTRYTTVHVLLSSPVTLHPRSGNAQLPSSIRFVLTANTTGVPVDQLLRTRLEGEKESGIVGVETCPQGAPSDEAEDIESRLR